MSRCQGCSAPIEWIETRTGRRIPLDPAVVEVVPLERGTVTAVTSDGGVVRGELVGSPRAVEAEGLFGAPRVSGRISHFATCPQALKFRKPRGTP